MSWLSDLGGTLGGIGSTLGAFVPGVGQAIAGVGGLLSMTDDPEALLLFPAYPYEPGGMAYGLSRTLPGGDPRGVWLGGNSWTNGPTYRAIGSSIASAQDPWRYFVNGAPQPMGSGLGGGSAIYDINGAMGAQGELAQSGQVFRLPGHLWDDNRPEAVARRFREEISLVYGALWEQDLETMCCNPVGMGPRRLFVQDDDSGILNVITVPPFAQIERAPLREIVEADRAKPAAEFWRDEWLQAPAPVFDASVANLRTWEEDGGGAVQTWMMLAPLWDQVGGTAEIYYGTARQLYEGYPSLASWRNLETPEAEAAYSLWQTHQAAELVKYQTAGTVWWEQKQQIEAQAAWDAYQAQAQAYYWQQWEENQAASSAYLADLTAYSNPFTQAPQAAPQAAQTSLSGDVAPEEPSPDLPVESLTTLPQPTEAPEPLTVGEEEAIGLGAAAALLIL
jgi:hypothetical protein